MKKAIALVAAVVLAGGGALAVVSPAQAAGPNFLETSNTVECGKATITLRNVSPWIYPVSVIIDGPHVDGFTSPTHSFGPTVDNRAIVNGVRVLNGPQQDVSATRTITFPEDSGTHTVSYRVAAGTENSLYRNKPVGEWTDLTVETDCLGDATVTAPSRTATYGSAEANLPFTPTISGLAEGDTPSSAGLDAVTCSTDAPVNPDGNYAAGTHAVTCTGPATTASYEVTYVAGTFTVGKAATSITELQVSALRSIANLGYKFKGTLVSAVTGEGIPNQVVNFSFPGPGGKQFQCSGTTNAGGVVSCFTPMTLANLLASLSLKSTVTFPGTADYLPSTQTRTHQL